MKKIEILISISYLILILCLLFYVIAFSDDLKNIPSNAENIEIASIDI